MAKELKRLGSIDTEKVISKNLKQMSNRASKPPYTPVDFGDLKNSRRVTKDTFGYCIEYAPHVEYGHRTTDDGYIKGQRFLQSNIEKQQTILDDDLASLLGKGER